MEIARISGAPACLMFLQAGWHKIEMDVPPRRRKKGGDAEEQVRLLLT